MASTTARLGKESSEHLALAVLWVVGLQDTSSATQVFVWPQGDYTLQNLVFILNGERPLNCPLRQKSMVKILVEEQQVPALHLYSCCPVLARSPL